MHLILASLWISGVAWLVLRYLMRTSSAFGDLPNPLEPWAMRAHALAAFATMWMLGQLWIIHVLPSWRNHRRISGIVLGSLLVVLIASGYLLYYVGDENTRATTAFVHWIVGIGLLVPWLVHSIAHRRRRNAHSQRR